MKWNEFLNVWETNVRVIIVGDNGDMGKWFYHEVVAICPEDRRVIFQVKWLENGKIKESIFCEDDVTLIRQHFLQNVYLSAKKTLRIDLFWQKDENKPDYQRETILLVGENEFYEVL